MKWSIVSTYWKLEISSKISNYNFLGCVPTRTLNHFKNQAKNKAEQYDIERWHDYEIANLQLSLVCIIYFAKI